MNNDPDDIHGFDRALEMALNSLLISSADIVEVESRETVKRRRKQTMLPMGY
jgi:hypothetical protein